MQAFYGVRHVRKENIVRKLIPLAGLLMLAQIHGASAQNFQLPNLGNMLEDALNPNRNDGQRRADDERRAEQERREAYRDGRADERRAYEDRARRDDRAGSPPWSRGRDDENRGRGHGNGQGRGNGNGEGRGRGHDK
ncbi:hypothetical protein [Falsiroseomonas sp. E2-1-a20]|uniref:hypothetical protein n=1 Tax=Falsiroseomonas sp. E2-1-a20 TaxID=3239300 RepID=UPI003F390957